MKDSTLKKYKSEAVANGLTFIKELTNTRKKLYRFVACKHTQEITPGHIRIGKFCCQACLDIKIEKEATDNGLTFIKELTNTGKKLYRFVACKHTQEIRPRNIRIGKFCCQACLYIKIEKEATQNGVEIVSELKGRRNLYRCIACKHTQEIDPSRVRTGEFCCQACLDIKIEKEATQNGVEIVSKLKGKKNLYRFVACKHTQEIDPSRVRTGVFCCHACFDIKIEKEATQNGVEIVSKLKGNNNLYRFISCKHTQEIQTGCVRSGSFCCQTCGESYTTNKSGIYILKIMDNKNKFYWLKLGVARNIKRRLSGYKLNGDISVDILVNIPIETNKEAVLIEKGVHKKYKGKSLDSNIMRKHMKSGFTECYNIQMLGTLKKSIGI